MSSSEILRSNSKQNDVFSQMLALKPISLTLIGPGFSQLLKTYFKSDGVETW